jgi:hypothetical protein
VSAVPLTARIFGKRHHVTLKIIVLLIIFNAIMTEREPLCSLYHNPQQNLLQRLRHVLVVDGWLIMEVQELLLQVLFLQVLFLQVLFQEGLQEMVEHQMVVQEQQMVVQEQQMVVQGLEQQMVAQGLEDVMGQALDANGNAQMVHKHQLHLPQLHNQRFRNHPWLQAQLPPPLAPLLCLLQH